MEQGEMNARARGGERAPERIALPGRFAVREPPDRDAVHQLHGLELRGAEHRDVGWPLDASIERPREQRVVISRGDQHAHRLPRSEGLREEPSGIDARALVLVQIAADRDRRAALVRGQAPGADERIAEPLPAPPRELSLAAHGREHPVEVEVGEMEETYRHAAGIESGDRERTSVRQSLAQVCPPNFCHNWRVPTRDPWPLARVESAQRVGDQVDYRLILSRRVSQAGAGLVGAAVAIRVLTLPVSTGVRVLDALAVALAACVW